MAANSRIDAPVETTIDQYNFCRAIDAMKKGPAWQTRQPVWLVAHPGDLSRIWHDVPPRICGLRVAEMPACPSNAFYLAGLEDFQDIAPLLSDCRGKTASPGQCDDATDEENLLL